MPRLVRWLALSVLVLILPVLAACGGTQSTASPVAKSTNTPAPIGATTVLTTTAAVGATTVLTTTAAVGATTVPTTTAAVAVTTVPTTTAAVAATKVPTTTAAVAATTVSTTTAVTLPDVNPATVTGKIVIAGSSTVFPLTERMAEVFRKDGYTGDITVDNIGTGGGFERFCVNAETDIANASRPITEAEAKACEAKGRPALGFRVGTDALAVVVSAENKFLTGLTKAQLAKIFSGEVKTWAELDPSYPAEPIKLFSPGTDSGTFDYFVEVIFAKDKTKILAANPQLSEDDNVLVKGIEGSPYAIGYFGYAYYLENKAKLKILTVEGIAPNETTAENNTYPLSRPLFIYSAKTVLTAKPQVAAFINYYLTNVSDEIRTVGYFPASAAALDEARQIWRANQP